jgi:hypothetical protein
LRSSNNKKERKEQQMKKIIGLACLLVLVAVLVVPMAATAALSTPITGTTVLPSIAVTAPVAFGFGTLALGDNFKAAANGSVVVTIGSSLKGNWQVIADSAVGYMQTSDNVNSLSEYQLCAETTAGPWFTADGKAHVVNSLSYPAGNLTYSGTATGAANAKVTIPLKFAVYQATKVSDVATARTYSITYTFTASVTP